LASVGVVGVRPPVGARPGVRWRAVDAGKGSRWSVAVQ